IVWSSDAPISDDLKQELQNASNAIKEQLDADPFSCCGALQALQELLIVLGKVVRELDVEVYPQGILLVILQILQSIFSSYITCL
ncbi:40-residue YVTN family beta-propeller, partial [Bacillus cereus]